MKTVRLIGGANPETLKVIDCDTGQPFTGIIKLNLSVEHGKPLVCEITQQFRVVGLDVAAECGRIDVAPLSPEKPA